MARPKTPYVPEFTASELEMLATLDDVSKVQAFLDDIPYSAEPVYRCPRRVIADRKAHCFDGAVFAAAALQRLGLDPLIIDLRAVRDDDHVLTLFWKDGHLGALSKSNVAMLRFREPLFRSTRELVLSYFDFYYNLDGEKSLREYSKPIDLRRFDALRWHTENGAMDVIAAHLDAVPHKKILTPSQEQALRPVDQRTYDAGLLGADHAGLYKPGGEKG